MNSTRYLLARVALSFGIHRKNKRMSEAADEMHLLRLAEEILGEIVWERAEDIEDISVEYWTLRKFMLQKNEIDLKANKAGDVLDLSHEERNAVLNKSNQSCLALEKKRDELFAKSTALVAERDEIISKARLLRRKFDASRTKIQVLSEDVDNAEIVQLERRKLSDYKNEFARLKDSRDEVGERITKLDLLITRIEESIAEDRGRLRQEASEAYQSIGKANRDISQLSAEIGLIELGIQEHFCAIGRYVSNHASTNPVCRQICKDHLSLIAQMQSLRSSIALNNKLVSMAGM
ncbi:MAG: hypothetical protein HN759_07245 [Akkermansiaceae bacterium]|jgi:chromosome segregation ATPase|nr:hypothetical protein [Akkermansiaceae bacterium]